MNITSKTHKSYEYYCQSLDKRTSSKSIKPTKKLRIFISNKIFEDAKVSKNFFL